MLQSGRLDLDLAPLDPLRAPPAPRRTGTAPMRFRLRFRFGPFLAIALCWLLHLYGDLHQPLHCVARFSPEFPDGSYYLLSWRAA